jgi:hypothetical protein
MRSVIISILLLGGFIALSTVEASAYVCARGVYRAGCMDLAGPSRQTSLPPLLRQSLPLIVLAGVQFELLGPLTISSFVNIIFTIARSRTL